MRLFVQISFVQENDLETRFLDLTLGKTPARAIFGKVCTRKMRLGCIQMNKRDLYKRDGVVLGEGRLRERNARIRHGRIGACENRPRRRPSHSLLYQTT